MGHKRISNKKIQQMLHDIMPEGDQKAKDDSLVEGKSSKKNEQTPLKLDSEQK